MKIPDPSKPLEQQDDDVLLAMCLFGEARGEGPEGMKGVANAVRNRALHPGNRTGRRYGDGIKGVVLRPGAFDCVKCSDVNYKKLLEPLKCEKPEIWQQCLVTAKATTAGVLADNTQGATHYYDDSLSVPPWWARLSVIEAGKMTPTVQIGRLLFFRET